MTKWNNPFSVFWPLIICASLAGCVSDDPPTDPSYLVTVDVSEITFTNEVLTPGDDLQQQVKIKFQGPGVLVGYHPDESPVPWLHIEVQRATDTDARLLLTAQLEDQIAPGTYSTILRVSTGESDTNTFAHADIPVTLKIYQFVVFGEPSFGAVLGTTEFDDQQIEIFGDTTEWTASADADWVVLGQETGTGRTTLDVNVDVASLTDWGAYTATITLEDAFSGTQQQIPVELALDSVRLFASDTSVALTALPHISQLTQQVKVNTNGLDMPTWTASTEQDWLTLQSDSANNTLTISADESLAADGLNQAIVTLAPVDDTLAEASEIAVSLLIQADDAVDVTIEDVTSNTNAIVANPIAPEIYVGSGTSLIAYNTYDGSELWRVDDLLADVTDLIISDNGDLLFANAQTEEVIPPEEEGGEETIITTDHVIRLVVADQTFEVFELAEDVISPPSRFLTFDNRGVLTNGLFEFFDTTDVSLLTWKPIVADDVAQFTVATSQAADTGAVFTNTQTNLYRAEGSFNSFKVQPVEFAETHTDIYTEESPIFNLEVRADESELITDGDANESYLFDGEVFTPNGLLTDNEDLIFIDLDINTMGQALFLRFDPTAGFKIYRHDTDNSLLSEDLVSISSTSGFVLTGDDQRLAMSTPATTDDDGNVTEEGTIVLTNSSPEPDALPFMGTFGDADFGSQTIELTGTALQWTAEGMDPWIVLDKTSGEGADTVTVSVDTDLVTDWGNLASGVYITDTQTQVRKRYPVDFALDSRRIFPSDFAIAFSQLSHNQQLSQDINILTNGESLIDWQITSAATWLSFTPGANGQLTITADPSSLPEGLTQTTATLSPVDAADGVGTVVPVSFYKRTAATADVTIAGINANNGGIVTDPLRHRVYVAEGSTITAYDLYDGSQGSQLTGLIADVTNLSVADDGSYLYGHASTTVDALTVRHLVKVDLSDFSQETLELAEEISTTASSFVRLSGLPMLASGAIQFVNPDDGSLVNNNVLDGDFVFNFSQSKGNDALFMNSSTTLYSLQADYNSMLSTEAITIDTDTNLVFSDSNLNGLFANANGDAVYSVGSVNERFDFDGTAFTEEGQLTQPDGAVTIAASLDENGESVFLRFDFTDFKFKLFRYASDNTPVSQNEVTLATTVSDMQLSGDNQRAVFTEDGQLVISNAR